MGVSGSGKSTIGKSLASYLTLPYLEADNFHPVANIEKMSKGHPLTDDDRAPWLTAIQLSAELASHSEGAVISCSALKQKYRNQLEDGLENLVVWIYLDGSFELILSRMKNRTDHFMPESLLRSQFDTLEIPQNAIKVDISESNEDIMKKLKKRIAEN